MKKIILGSVLLLSGLTLAGCGNHQAQSQSNAQSSSAKPTATSQKAKQAQGPWNQTKDHQLAAFINQWAPTMGQQYQRYDGKHEMKIATGYHYPSQLKQTTVNGSQTSIGWAPTGKGQYAYNVVALYNDDQGGNRHITYAFAFHDGQPVALVDQGTSGTPNWTLTKNADVANHFAQIAAGQSSQSTPAPAKGKSQQTSTPANVTPDQIAVMIYSECYPDDDIAKESEFGTWSVNGNNFVGNGGPVTIVKYRIDGDNVYYSRKSGGEYGPEQVISVKELVSHQYSTPEQKQVIDATASSMTKSGEFDD